MRLNVKDLKSIASKLSQAVEESKLNPKSGWVELEADTESITFKVSNVDYYMNINLLAESTIDEKDVFHTTILANTFIPLISKLDDDYIELHEELNSLVLKTSSSTYNFPVIKELGKVKCLDTIPFTATTNSIDVDGSDLASVSDINTKNVIGSTMSRSFQQYIYVDNIGALTFTESVYINNFPSEIVGDSFKILLNISQAQLLSIFKGVHDLKLELEQKPTYGDYGPTTTNKVKIYNDNMTLIMITQYQDMVDKFPSIRLRAYAENELDTHVALDRKELDKALARLMVFDKKFGTEVIDYSKLIFGKDSLQLVSVKNKNSEVIPYVSSQNVIEGKESVIRFADLVKQLKVATSKYIDIGYNQRPVLIINNDGMRQVIMERVVKSN